ncbi:MAG: TrkH family potassium uptake protein [Bacteroidetes bacterium]|nr:TrkH family potassium uptake protein [Bacteroidota bacterium]MBU1719515.1 TrkH family potassium uptake protein [Bacteroidota bacterium]
MPTRKAINFQVIIRFIGMLLMLEALFMWSGLGFSFYYGNDPLPLLISGGITFAFGGLVWLLTKNADNSNIGKREGYIIVSFTWIVISFFGALPFLISGYIPGITDAFFETMSGFTTTGASILRDIEIVPRDILFWRSMTHWIGGMGIIVLTLAILPMLGIGGMQLFVAEVPGPTPDKLHPRITGTAKRLWGIYVLLTLVQTVLLLFGGMDLHESLCHTFGTMATGGFSTRNASVAAYSPYIQYVIIFFMFLAGMNFTLHYFALKGKLKTVWKNEEFRYYLFLMVIISLIIAAVLVIKSDKGIETAIRDSLFQVVSITTTTGFVTSDYLLWPGYLWFLLFLLFFTGGCAGSTGGGIKVIRQLLLFKNSRLELRRLVHPQAVLPVKLNGKSVSQDIIFNILAFYLIYMLIFAFGTAIMTVLGLDFQTSIGSVAATLGNIGPGIGDVGPVCNYADMPDAGKWFLSFFMLLGRLELFTVLILFSFAFWKK